MQRAAIQRQDRPPRPGAAHQRLDVRGHAGNAGHLGQLLVIEPQRELVGQLGRARAARAGIDQRQLRIALLGLAQHGLGRAGGGWSCLCLLGIGHLVCFPAPAPRRLLAVPARHCAARHRHRTSSGMRAGVRSPRPKAVWRRRAASGCGFRSARRAWPAAASPARWPRPRSATPGSPAGATTAAPPRPAPVPARRRACRPSPAPRCC